ncbi:MAG: hypothetical protein ACI9PU_001471 [Ascidiaceihabitans sp.]|mgnify:CR=1 FL=1|jgi:hypothetical protein
MIPFLTEILELAGAGLLLAGAMPFLKNPKVLTKRSLSVSACDKSRNLTIGGSL